MGFERIGPGFPRPISCSSCRELKNKTNFGLRTPPWGVFCASGAAKLGKFLHSEMDWGKEVPFKTQTGTPLKKQKTKKQNYYSLTIAVYLEPNPKSFNKPIHLVDFKKLIPSVFYRAVLPLLSSICKHFSHF